MPPSRSKADEADQFTIPAAGDLYAKDPDRPQRKSLKHPGGERISKEKVAARSAYYKRTYVEAREQSARAAEVARANVGLKRARELAALDETRSVVDAKRAPVRFEHT